MASNADSDRCPGSKRCVISKRWDRHRRSGCSLIAASRPELATNGGQAEQDSPDGIAGLAAPGFSLAVHCQFPQQACGPG